MNDVRRKCIAFATQISAESGEERSPNQVLRAAIDELLATESSRFVLSLPDIPGSFWCPSSLSPVTSLSSDHTALAVLALRWHVPSTFVLNAIVPALVGPHTNVAEFDSTGMNRPKSATLRL
jgi:hypothetical protein